MVQVYKRAGDHPDFDPVPQRRVDPAAWDLQLGWGDKKLSVRGIAIIFFLTIMIIIGSNAYFHVRLETLISDQQTENKKGHERLVRNGEQTSCILTMTVDERIRFRQEFRPDSWSRWCGWIDR